MGYTTEFEGFLKFKNPLDIEQLKLLETFMGEDPDNHPEWLRNNDPLSYIQWEITKDYSGIQWDGGEKFYYPVESVNFILANMQDKFPNFGLEGELQASGEDFDDRWVLAIKDGKAVRIESPKLTDVVKCPHCDERFSLSETK